MRINVYISSTGFCSRREADRLIKTGRVNVDGVMATIGMDIVEGSTIFIDEKPIKTKPKTVYLAFNKPEGIESTTDQTKKNNIIDYIGFPERIFPIGRLDKDTSGLILLTNDGMIVNQILRSENEHEKEYLVEVDHAYDHQFINQMESGVFIYNPVRHETVKTKSAKIYRVSEVSFRIIITQGMNLQIRRMCSSLGYRVIRLKRQRIINIELGNLEIGNWRHLTEQEMTELLEQVH
jgi:pseudouridine synthase